MQRPGPADFTGDQVSLLTICPLPGSELNFLFLNPTRVVLNNRIYHSSGYAVIVYPEILANRVGFYAEPLDMQRRAPRSKQVIHIPEGDQPPNFRPDTRVVDFPSQTVRLRDVTEQCRVTR